MSKISFRIVLSAVLISLISPVAMANQTSVGEALDALNSRCPLEYRQFAASAISPVQLRDYYRELGDRLQWQSVARRAQLQTLLDDLRHDGLPTHLYQAGLQRAGQQAAVELCTDVTISHGYLLALRHLQRGALDQAKVEPYWVEQASALRALPSTLELALRTPDDLEQSLNAARPAQVLYARLREQMRTVNQRHDAASVQLPAGKSLRPDTRDPRTAVLRKRLLLDGYLSVGDVDESAMDDDLYEGALVDAVRLFQRDHYLDDDGVIGPATLRELNVTPAQRLAQVRVNLERLRWLEAYLEPDILIVDIAGARLLYLEDGRVTWRTRTQVGTVARKTPLLKSRITHLTMNPTWTVPPTILRQDKLPAIRKDPSYLARNRMQVLDGQGQVLDPEQVDWSAPGNIMLRQAAGPGNALGQVAIRFANPFSVYLHDTPSQHLFGRATRTVSSGCVRVEDVQRLLDLLAADEPTARAVASAKAAGKTRQVNLAQPVPVLLAYLTVEVDADGRVRYRPDSYGYDGRIAAALERL
ncbi:MAG: L,D-transpeptidase family protein [Thiopseudomonas sp.]|nr:L,D-transpeptidase family protein [Thiopseudomonas sp.]